MLRIFRVMGLTAMVGSILLKRLIRYYVEVAMMYVAGYIMTFLLQHPKLFMGSLQHLSDGFTAEVEILQGRNYRDPYNFPSEEKD